MATETVNIAKCTARRCSYAFEPPSNLPSSYDSVSVAAENGVGVGATRSCTTQPISKLGDSWRLMFDSVHWVTDIRLVLAYLLSLMSRHNKFVM